MTHFYRNNLVHFSQFMNFFFLEPILLFGRWLIIFSYFGSSNVVDSCYGVVGIRRKCVLLVESN